MPYDLNGIKNPLFLKEMTIEELKDLSNDIRKFLIEKTSATGGHLSSNLGVVELTIALHRVFNSPIDKFIFDVSHQAYIHKILTGRAKDFDTLRQYKGLSGFTKREESEHDPFEAGHSSTSISAQAGFEVAKNVLKDGSIGRTVSIIGDGSINNGLAFEAMNFMGEYQTNSPIIILNDNVMSITKNVGAITKVFDRLRSKKFKKLRRKVSLFVPKALSGLKERTNQSIKGFAKKNNVFEEFGFLYLGPINGHDYKGLINALEFAKEENRPILLHVVTEKGKGYKYAEKDIYGKWHGIGPFNVETGVPKAQSKEGYVSWSKLIANKLENMAATDKKLQVITPAMIAGSGLQDFQMKYPDKLIDVGIAEGHAVCMAAAMSLGGLNTFVSIYSTFAQRAYDQILHDVSRQNAKVVFGIDRAGLVGEDGDTHQGIYDIPMLNHIPNMIIAHPYDAQEAHSLLDLAMYKNDKPFAIRFPRGSVANTGTDILKEIEVGTWEYIETGNEINIIAFGRGIDYAKKACDDLGVKANIINARFIKPLDYKMLDEIAANGKPIIIHEESIINGGLGMSIVNYYIKAGTKMPEIKLMGIDDLFVEHGETAKLLESLKLDAEAIKENILKILKR